MKLTIKQLRSLIKESFNKKNNSLSDIKKGSMIHYDIAYEKNVELNSGSFIVKAITNSLTYDNSWFVDVDGTLPNLLNYYINLTPKGYVAAVDSLKSLVNIGKQFTSFDAFSKPVKGLTVKTNDGLTITLLSKCESFRVIEVKTDKNQYAMICEQPGKDLFKAPVKTIYLDDITVEQSPQTNDSNQRIKSSRTNVSFTKAWDEYHYDISDGESDQDELISHMFDQGWELVGTVGDIGIENLKKGDVVTPIDNNEFYRFVLGAGMIETLGGRSKERLTSATLDDSEEIWRRKQ